MIVSYYDGRGELIEFSCSTAIKGSDYVYLLDENGNKIVSFDGVSNCDIFSISGGEWSYPAPEDECKVAVVGPDGSIKPSGHKCGAITPMYRYFVDLFSTSSFWTLSNGTYTKRFYSASMIDSDCIVIIMPSTESSWAYSNLKLEVTDSYVEFSTTVLPASTCRLGLCVFRVYANVGIN